MKRYKIVGLTGQTGAGKSTVSKVFQKNGFALINADEIVKELYQPKSICLKNLSIQFGEDIILNDGTLDRKKLAERVFSSKENTKLINDIIHPFVMAEFLKKLQFFIDNNYEIIVFDAPQLFESKANLICDIIISVVADKENRIKRICERDNISKQMAENRINAQLSEEFFVNNSDLILENNSTKQELEEKAYKILQLLK